MRDLSILLSVVMALFSPSTFAETATEIVRQSDLQMRGDSSYTEATMKIIRPGWTRSMSMKTWSKGMDLSLVLVTAPAKDKGSASLKRQREMWNWIQVSRGSSKSPLRCSVSLGWLRFYQ